MDELNYIDATRVKKVNQKGVEKMQEDKREPSVEEWWAEHGAEIEERWKKENAIRQQGYNAGYKAGKDIGELVGIVGCLLSVAIPTAAILLLKLFKLI